VNVQDRVTYNEPDDYLGPALFLGSVDEIVLTGASVHIESLGDSCAYLCMRAGNREIEGRIRAVPTTRRQRRAMLAHTDDRLHQRLRTLLPWPAGRVIWSIPPWQRPAAAWREWREACRQAHAALLIDIDTDADMEDP
jgi:hypothetical protein